MKQTILLGSSIGQLNEKRLSHYSHIIHLEGLNDFDLASVLPTVDSLLVFSWPKQLTAEKLSIMKRLRFVQNILAGVNQVPFERLPSRVLISSNAGAYSDEVAEYAIALLLSAAKRIVKSQASIKSEKWNFQRTMETGESVVILKGKTLGILGHGGIGRAAGKIGKSLQLRVFAYGRSRQVTKGVSLLQGKTGLSQIIRESNVVILALPLTLQTKGIIDQAALNEMKKDAILVNVARGELVDQKSIYDHLVANPSFQYATDVWWYREGKETLHTDYPFMSLPNFIGTPHLSGPSGFATGNPTRLAVENLVRYLRGLRPRNIVNRSDYVNGGVRG